MKLYGTPPIRATRVQWLLNELGKLLSLLAVRSSARPQGGDKCWAIALRPQLFSVAVVPLMRMVANAGPMYCLRNTPKR